MRLANNLSLVGLLRLAGSPFLDGLVSYWPLNELSGQRNDVVGSNHLTDINTVGSALRGPQGTVAEYTAANSERLTSSGPTPANRASGVTFAAWAKETVAQTTVLAFAEGPDTRLVMLNNSVIRFSYGTSIADSPVNTMAVWHFIVGWWDPADQKARIQVDNGTPAVATVTQAMLSTALTGFHVGGHPGIAYATFIESTVGVWDGVLSNSVKTSLFNSGHGKRYADLTTDEKVGLVSYWNLDEVSGQRNDSHGTNHLTDNNTVTSVINVGDAMSSAAATFVGGAFEELDKTSFLLPSANFTVSLWVWYSTNLGTQPGFFGVGTAWTTDTAFNLYLFTDSKIRGLFGDAVSYRIADSSTVTTGNAWFNVICAYDAATTIYTLYVNNDVGVSSLALQGAPDRNAGTLRIGSYTGGNPWTGKIDEVALWSRILTADERTALYNAGAGKFYPF